jgi:hypothetical protein
MTLERYFQWIRVWEWFATVDRTAQLESLYNLLDELWHDEHKNATPEELLAHVGLWDLEQ